jgi:hypothetical protein
MRGNRGARLAAGVALVHRDDAKLVGELAREWVHGASIRWSTLKGFVRGRKDVA